LNDYEKHVGVSGSMYKEFNLLATTSRGYERYASSELRFLLEKIGDDAPHIERTGVSGLIAIKTKLDAFDVIKQFRAILRQHPYEFRFTLRVIPVEKIVQTDMNQIQEAVEELGSKVTENETFRITVEKRFTRTHSRDIIEKAAAKVKRKVDLTTPNKIVLIEVVGGLTGVSVINPEDVLSVLKEKLL
jgi:tRNA acetyltransferase TAN1